MRKKWDFCTFFGNVKMVAISKLLRILKCGPHTFDYIMDHVFQIYILFAQKPFGHHEDTLLKNTKNPKNVQNGTHEAIANGNFDTFLLIGCVQRDPYVIWLILFTTTVSVSFVYIRWTADFQNFSTQFLREFF
jgi:hypothetical protein